MNDTADLFASYLGPEDGEIVTLTIDDSNAANLIIAENEPGIEATFHGLLVGQPEYVGFHTIEITATDDGSPAASVTQTFVIEVLDVAAPSISISGEEVICAGVDAVWTVEPEGLDYYIWSNGDQGPEQTQVEIGYGGDFTVQAFQDGCVTTESFFINELDYFLPQLSYDPSAFACDGSPVEVCINGDWPAGSWFDCLDDPSIECNDPGYWEGPCAMLEPGFYVAHALDEGGCEGRNIFQVFEQTSFIPDLEFDPFCGELTPAEFEGGFANPGEGNLTIWMTDADGNFANGSFLLITVNGTEQFTFAMLNGGTFDWNTNDQQVPISWGDEIVVEYIASGSDDGNNSVQLYNCGENTPVYDGAPQGSGIIWEGVAACEAEEATGVWSQVSCPQDGNFSSETDFNGTFTPLTYGTYTLQFAEGICNVVHEFELEWTEAPTNVTITPNNPQLLCDGEDIELEVTYTIPTECGADISWIGATPDPNDIT
ncbi:MAG: hypothetical protein HKN32_06455, partial [Flavobacteriales bacterium]|nr:hypothetical protein [Flavobacteriales bacterium]